MFSSITSLVVLADISVMLLCTVLIKKEGKLRL